MTQPPSKANTSVNFVRWLLLIVGIACLLFAGILYAWSILKVPLSEEFNWSASDLATNYTITISLFCLGCVAGGMMMRKFSPRVPVIFGAILAFTGFFLTSRLQGDNVTALFVFYGVFAGFGIGMAYNTILAAVGAWFPDKKGFASGCLMMGFGASTLILGNLADSLINQPDFGWRKVFMALAVCTGALLLIMGALIRLPGANTPLPKAKSNSSGTARKEIFDCVDMSPGQMLRRMSFWIFFLSMLLLGAAGNSVISFAKDFSLSVGTSVAATSLYVGILSVFNGLGRIVAGLIFDRFGRKVCMAYVGIISILANTLCLLAALMNSPILCLLGFCAIGLSYGGNTNAVSIFITAFYGNKYYAQNLSLGLLTLLPASFLARLSTTLLSVTGGYLVPFAVLAAYSVVSLTLNTVNRRP